MKKNLDKIPGIKFDVIKWNEAQLMGRFILTISDAEELCKKTKSDLYKNETLKEWFFDQLTNTLSETINNIKKGRTNEGSPASLTN